MVETENAKTVRRYFDACNSGALADFMPTLAGDVVHYFLPGRISAIFGAEHLAVLRKFKEVSDAVWSIDQIVAEGDRVVSEWSLTWTPQGRPDCCCFEEANGT